MQAVGVVGAWIGFVSVLLMTIGALAWSPRGEMGHVLKALMYITCVATLLLIQVMYDVPIPTRHLSR